MTTTLPSLSSLVLQDLAGQINNYDQEFDSGQESRYKLLDLGLDLDAMVPCKRKESWFLIVYPGAMAVLLTFLSFYLAKYRANSVFLNSHHKPGEQVAERMGPYLFMAIVLISTQVSTATAISHVQVMRQFQENHIESSNVACPCSDPKWCEPIKDTTRKEVYAFALHNDASHFKFYDWSKVTTVVMFGWINLDLMCLAHSHGARVASLASVDKKTFLNKDLRKQWINQQLNTSKINFLDGLNFDYESVINENETDVREGYTALVRETSETFKKELPYFQVTVDVAWKPNIDVRYYDYLGLAESSDFLFVMAYDEQSQIFGECIAGPNSNWRWAVQGLQIYMKELEKAIPANKLVLGVPWYGYIYNCIKMDEETCFIEQVPFRGVNCSDAAGSQLAYPDILEMAKQKETQWNATSRTPFFSYFDSTSGINYQVQYDDLESLSLKYEMAAKLDIRGVGMWNIDYLDYSDTKDGAEMRKAMFGILPNRTDYVPPSFEAKPLRFQRPEELELKAGYNGQRSQQNYGKNNCPCSDAKLCEPIKDMKRKEVFAYSTENNETHWKYFDWAKLTTVASFGYINSSLICLAHSHNVRVVARGDIDEFTLITPSLRLAWIKRQAQIIKDNFLDGLNFDYEQTLLPPQHYYRKEFTELVRDTVSALRAVQPYAQVSVCTVFNSSSLSMTYDYPALAQAADFLFIMAYDEHGSLHNGPNAGYHLTQAGVQTFLDKNISADKLVLGLPWYGDVYQCVSLVGDDCTIEPAGKGFGQWSYVHIKTVLDEMPDRYRWNASSLTPYFTYTDTKTNKSHMVQYDDPRSLTYKYQLAAKMGLRGVGMFTIDLVDYSNTDRGQSMRHDMFDPLPSRNQTISSN